MKLFNTDKAPSPAGHYSQAVIHGGLVYISGQLPVVPVTGEKITGEIEDQARQAFLNLKAIIDSSGSGIERVIKTTVKMQKGEIDYVQSYLRINGIFSFRHSFCIRAVGI